MFHKFLTFISKPGHFFRSKSIFMRKLYFVFSKYLHTQTYFQRKIKNDLNIKSFNNGYLKLSPNDLNKIGINIDKIINEVEKKVMGKKKNIDNNKSINILLNSKDFEINSCTFNFVTNDSIIKIISNYIGLIPLLTHISYWYSPNTKIIENSSQEYHLDHEDYKQVKGFFLLEDVDEECGPTVFLNSKVSKKIINEINYKNSFESKRVDEGIIGKFKGENQISCTGKRGTLYLIDTSNCFHFGSRKSLKPRKILAFQFISTCSTSLMWDWKKSSILHKPFWQSDELSKNQKLILGID